MTDAEYDIIDELYFVTSYASLKEESGYSDEELLVNLISLVNKGLVKVYASMDEELGSDRVDLKNEFKSYSYLASKKGLFEHNRR